MHVAWTIERFLNGALVVGVGALLSLQLLARPRHAAQVAPLKVLFHRLGLLSVALKVPHSIDPGGVAGVISDPIITIFDTNALALLVGFATAFAYFMVSAVFGTKLAPPPAGLRAGLIAINLITLPSVDVLLVLWAAMDREFYRGVQYLVWAFYITVVSSVLFFAAFKLHSSMRTLFKTSAPVDRDGSGDQRSEMLRKLMFFQVVGAVAAIGCVYQLVARGISRARDPHAAIQIESSDKYPPFSIVALYGYWFFMLLFTWWTYTDITVLWRSSEAPASQHLVPLLSGADEEGPVRMQHRSLRASSAASIVDDRETGGVEDYKRFEEVAGSSQTQAGPQLKPPSQFPPYSILGGGRAETGN
jgi:hypothetical protein